MLTPQEKLAILEANNQNTVFAALGIRVESYDPDAVCVAIDVDGRHYQHAGIVHGGVYVTLAESAASISAALKTDLSRYAVFGLEINANHLRPVHSGTIRAIAKPVHQGKTTLVYSIELRDQDNRLVCISRCTIAIKELPA